MSMDLSIVIPVYNDLEEFRACLDNLVSLKKGRFNNMEVVVVDDGSSRDIRSVFQEYSKTNSNFKWVYIRLKVNSGRFIARLEGVKKAAYDNILLMDARALIASDFFKVLSTHQYQPIIPLVKTPCGESWVGRVMYLMRSKLYARTYGELANSGEVTLTLDNYESHGKGTTVLFIDRKTFLTACKNAGDMDRYSNEESWLLRGIISQRPIKIMKSLVVSYNQRNNIWDECIHFFLRGPRFVQNYINPGTRFFPHLIILLVFAVVCLAILVISPWLIIYPLILFILFILALSIIISEKPSDVPKSIILLPLLVLSYTFGIYWGLIVNITKGNLRRLQRG